MTQIPSAIKVSFGRIGETQRQSLRWWLPACLTAAIAWLALLSVGETPIARASGLALAILGFTASMRRMGFVASIGGGLTLAFCPIFWSQSGAGGSNPSAVALAAGFALVVTLAAGALLKRGYVGVGLGIVVFLSVFWTQMESAQSLRLTGLVTAWLMYLLVDMIMLTNPRPGTKPACAPKAYHTAGLLFLLAIGAINDPLVVLLAPALLLSLFLSYARLPLWYWSGMLLVVFVGLLLLAQTYALPQSSLLDLLGWRDAERWIGLGELLSAQFSIFGGGAGCHWAGASFALVSAAGNGAAYCLRGLYVFWPGIPRFVSRDSAVATGHDPSNVDDICGEYVWAMGQQDIVERITPVDASGVPDLPRCSCHFALEYRTILKIDIAVAPNSKPCIVEWKPVDFGRRASKAFTRVQSCKSY